ncbi:MAG: hypothetical protein IJX94_01325 [Clostridia bacterium]|nr:hypothetical protein [Clostridia bacterium]
MKNVQKSYAITDAKISFVSLVDKAANKRQFLITKAEDGQAQFATYGRILKTDAEHHFVTGVVYEPMTEDAHGNHMSEEEITKAAYWFAKNGDGVDLQHSFETLEKAAVVESWVAKADFELGGETVKKGSWLMTVEITDEAVWDAVQKGELTGFSMGGVGLYSTEDEDLTEVKKNDTPNKQTEHKGILKKLAEMFGFDVVEKGAVADRYAESSKVSNFWNAFYALEDTLYRYNYATGTWDYENDETVIREALTDFSNIITDILAGSEIAKSLAVEKSGKTLSAKNKESLTNIYNNLGAFLAEVEDEKEEKDMTKSEIEKIVADAVAKAMAPAQEEAPAAPDAPAEITVEGVQKMVEDAVAKALAPKEEAVTPENVNDIVEKAVKKAIEPILKSRALSTALGDGDAEPVEKGEAHYLTGIL